MKDRFMVNGGKTSEIMDSLLDVIYACKGSTDDNMGELQNSAVKKLQAFVTAINVMTVLNNDFSNLDLDRL